jgi:hypothetical protein
MGIPVDRTLPTWLEIRFLSTTACRPRRLLPGPASPPPRLPAYFNHVPPSTTKIAPVIHSPAGLAR